jgi:hypothetical protein
MIDLEKIKNILWNISKDDGPLGSNTLPDKPSCVNLSKKNVKIQNYGKEPFDIIIIDENFKKYKILDNILSKNGKIICLYGEIEAKKIVDAMHSTKIFFWCEWLKNEKIIIFKRFKDYKDNWQGQRANFGETLTIYSARGWGDIFHNLRYLKKIQRLFNGKILFETRTGLDGLIKINFECEIIERKKNHKSTYFFEICRSKKILGDMIYCKNYLTAPKQEKIANLGVAWDSHHLTFKNKTVDPLIFKNFQNYKILSLQKFTHQKQDNTPPFFIKKPINNWLDTAVLINSVDAVIAVDTGVAHLAAAMGKTVHVLLEGYYETSINKSPNWYQNVNILRQENGWMKPIAKALHKSYL